MSVGVPAFAMRACQKWASFLLPVLSLSLVLPNDHLTAEVLNSPSLSLDYPLPLPTGLAFEYSKRTGRGRWFLWDEIDLYQTMRTTPLDFRFLVRAARKEKESL